MSLFKKNVQNSPKKIIWLLIGNIHDYSLLLINLSIFAFHASLQIPDLMLKCPQGFFCFVKKGMFIKGAMQKFIITCLQHAKWDPLIKTGKQQSRWSEVGGNKKRSEDC